MKVKVSQLIPGCILQQDVIGKTGQPIIPKQTTLTAEHINILEKFLITDVHIFNELADGTHFHAKKRERTVKQTRKNDSILNLYDIFIQTYEKQYEQWKMNQKIDMATLRQNMLPLIEQMLEHEAIDLIRQINLSKKNKFYFQQTFSSFIATWLGKRLDYRKGELYQIFLANLLKDSGFIKLPESYEKFATMLFEREREKIIEHPILSYRLIENSPLLNQAAKMCILQHEERQDGSGYPLKLKGSDIHRYAKITMISDMFTKAFSFFFLKKSDSPLTVAVNYLKNEQTEKLDQQILHLFVQYLEENR